MSIFDGQEGFSDQTFEGLDGQGLAVGERDFENCVFKKCNFSGAEFKRCRFLDCTFENCDLSNLKILGSTFRGTTFVESKLVGVNWMIATRIAHLTFRKCNLSYSIFSELDLRKSEMTDCLAREAEFSEANLTGSNLQGTDFIGARFGNTNLTQADLRRAINYTIRIGENKIRKARFSLPEATLLLHSLDIILEE